MTTQPLSDAEIADTRRQHHEWKFGGGIVLCAACGSAYPCSTIRALDELTTLRTAHAAALDEIRSWYGDRNLVAEAHSECRRDLAAALIEALERERALVAALDMIRDDLSAGGVQWSDIGWVIDAAIDGERASGGYTDWQHALFAAITAIIDAREERT